MSTDLLLNVMATALGQRRRRLFIMTVGFPVPLIPHGFYETGETIEGVGEQHL